MRRAEVRLPVSERASVAPSASAKPSACDRVCRIFPIVIKHTSFGKAREGASLWMR
jgi:hypothetical protein